MTAAVIYVVGMATIIAGLGLLGIQEVKSLVSFRKGEH